MQLIEIVILLLSVIVHEVAHGLMAYKQGDPTAKIAGRLTLNPIRHIDPIGTILVPILLFTTTGFLFGWAKPVPYNPNNFRNRRRGTLLVASAGVLMNIIIAAVFSIIIRLIPDMAFLSENFAKALTEVSVIIISINLLLAIFNLVPIPPLDGSRILFSLLPSRFFKYEVWLDRYSLLFVLIFVFFGWKLLFPVLNWVFAIFVGSGV